METNYTYWSGSNHWSTMKYKDCNTFLIEQKRPGKLNKETSGTEKPLARTLSILRPHPEPPDPLMLMSMNWWLFWWAIVYVRQDGHWGMWLEMVDTDCESDKGWREIPCIDPDVGEGDTAGVNVGEEIIRNPGWSVVRDKFVTITSLEHHKLLNVVGCRCLRGNSLKYMRNTHRKREPRLYGQSIHFD